MLSVIITPPAMPTVIWRRRARRFRSRCSISLRLTSYRSARILYQSPENAPPVKPVFRGIITAIIGGQRHFHHLAQLFRESLLVFQTVAFGFVVRQAGDHDRDDV